MLGLMLTGTEFALRGIDSTASAGAPPIALASASQRVGRNGRRWPSCCSVRC